MLQQGALMIHTRPLFTLSLELHPPQLVGATPYGQRRIAPIAGGSFTGDRLRGSVLPHAGSDWLLERADGATQLDVRLALTTDDGAMIGMTYRGVRHSTPEIAARLARGEPVEPTEYYLRTAPFFETAAPAYAWLNKIVSIGTGHRTAHGVIYDVHEVL
jgi:hypothetical protein